MSLLMLAGALVVATVDLHTPRWARPPMLVFAGVMLGLALGGRG